jgi:hypothetical protein
MSHASKDHPFFPSCSRHRTTIPQLKEMVPEDMVTYCQEHGLLDDTLGGAVHDDGDDTSPLGLPSVGSNRGQYFQSLE